MHEIHRSRLGVFVEIFVSYFVPDGVMVSEALLENPAFFSGRIPDSVDIAQEYH